MGLPLMTAAGAWFLAKFFGVIVAVVAGSVYFMKVQK